MTHKDSFDHLEARSSFTDPSGTTHTGEIGGGGGGPWVDVRDHGADPTANDNTAEIQAAIDAADPANGGPGSVLFPEFYDLRPGAETALTVPGDMELFGLGPTTGVYNHYSTTDMYPNTCTFGLASPGEKFHFHDMFIRGNQTDDVNTTSNQNSNGAQIGAPNSNTTDVHISNVWALDAHDFIRFQGDGLVVTNVTLLNHARGFAIEYADNVTINNVTHKRYAIDGRDGFVFRGVITQGPRRLSISNYTIDGIGDTDGGGTGILLDANYSRGGEDISISNVNMRARSDTTTAKAFYIKTDGYDLRRISISDCNTDGFEDTIHFAGNASDTVEDLTFDNVTGAPQTDSIDAVNAASFHDVTFRNCRITGAPMDINPANANDYSNWRFENCYLYAGDSNPHTIGTTAVEDFTFDGCYFESGASPALDINGTGHGRLRFWGADVVNEFGNDGLDVEGASRLEVMRGQYSSLTAQSGVSAGYIKNTELTGPGLTNTAGLTTENNDGA